MEIERISLRYFVSFYLIVFVSISINAEFKLGIENIPSKLISSCAHKKVGLITNQTGKDQKGNRTVDILLKKGFKIAAIFAPEHGFEGKVDAEKEVGDGIDAKTKIPIISLYERDRGKTISSQMLKNVNVLVVDLQDSGMRHYTYISTLFYVLRAAAQEGKEVIVFDRPNPLGSVMEGPLVDPALISFISIASIPLRHGMTIGELAEYFNRYLLEDKVALQVIPMCDYERNSPIDCIYAPLSPNIASLASCHGYSFLGLLGEVKPFDVGVGTDQAFQLITLAEKNSKMGALWPQLAARLKKLGIVAKPYRYFNTRKKEYYKGLSLKIAHIGQLSSFTVFLLTVLYAKQAGVSLEFNVNFDKAVGSKLVRHYLTGMMNYKELNEAVTKELHQFFQKAQPLFKYKPYPTLMTLRPSLRQGYGGQSRLLGL